MTQHEIEEFVQTLPIVDVHEHHIPEVFLNQEIGLLDLLQQSYAGWTVQRPYPLPSESREEDPMLSGSGPATWEQISAFVVERGSNHFVRNVEAGIAQLFDLDQGITSNNWESVDELIRQRRRDSDWPHEVMKRAGVGQIVTDCYLDPLLDVKEALGQHYTSVMRINALAMGHHPDKTCHNGNSPFEFAQRLGVPCETFEQFCELLEHLVRTLADRNQVALKNALAYDRDLHFDEPDEGLARRAWRNADASEAECKAFGDFVVDRICEVAAAVDVPVQMHLGTAILRGSHPMNVAALIERHPRTRFLLMHLAYPWSSDLLALAFVYRNVWIDLTWSFLLSPTHFKRAFHEAIEILPDEARMMVGGDNWHAEESFATFQLFRKLMGQVLREKVEDGYFGVSDAKRLALRICNRNAKDFLRL